jgi:hypothetical protein
MLLVRGSSLNLSTILKESVASNTCLIGSVCAAQYNAAATTYHHRNKAPLSFTIVSQKFAMAAKKAAATTPVNKTAPKAALKKKAAPKRKAPLKKKAALQKKAVPKQVVAKPAADSSKPAARKLHDPRPAWQHKTKLPLGYKVISPWHVIFYGGASHYCSTGPSQNSDCQVAQCFSPDKVL